MQQSNSNQTSYPDVFMDSLIGEPTKGPLTKHHSLLKYLMLAVLIVSPIPLGSNRPLFWALWALVMACIMTWYMITVYWVQTVPRVLTHKFSVVGVMFCIVLIYMGLQCLPIGGLWGGVAFSTQSGNVIASGSLSLTPGDTWLSFLRWATYGMFFYLMLQTGARSQRARYFLKAIIVITSIQALYALFALTQLGDTVLFIPKTDHLGNATGTFTNRNSLATYLSLGAILALSFVIRPSEATKKTRRHSRTHSFFSPHPDKVWVLVALVFLIVGLLTTQSRMGVVSGFAGLLTVLLLRMSQMTNVRFVFFAGPLVIALLVVLFGAGLADRYIDLSSAFDTRFGVYNQILNMIADRPFTGFGAGSFEHAFPLYHGLEAPTNVVWGRAHSTYLAHWSEMGLIVGSLPLLIVGLLAWKLIKQTFGKNRLRTEVIAAIGATVTIALHSLFDFSMEIQAVVLLYLAIMAIALGSQMATKGKRSPRTGSNEQVSKTLGDRAVSRNQSPHMLTENSIKRKERRKNAQDHVSVRPRLHFPKLPSAVYAIGDVHGRLDLLQDLEAKIVHDASTFDGEKWIVLLGDFVDRGPQSAQVIEHILYNLPAGLKRFCIAGNHEVMMQSFFQKVPGSNRWLGFGGEETLRSYGLSGHEIEQIAKGDASSDYLLSSQVPQEHVDFLKNLPDALVTPKHIFLHIGMDESYSIASEVDFAASLSRQESHATDPALIIHGHRVVSEPSLQGHQLNIDTGAYETGCLTAVRIIPNEELLFLDTKA
ncbi:hypothetical protein C0081_16650 [Cohaesibacter celericrescens]|uniref:Uncharacterized protein n=2 Tax=Cohaesibacter celericrescens TaxID=2067669 RepID=A0A2N5XND0_9HYPH|nr:hypothetical protein C0081_16650 [Cohaesibacter celericrescens]